MIYTVPDGARYEQSFIVAEWENLQKDVIESISCTSGSVTIGINVKARPVVPEKP